jgi:hypothetical protein
VTRIGELGTTLSRSVLRLLVTANVVSSSPVLFTLMMEAIPFSETSALTRATRHNVPEDGILHKHRRENIKSYRENRTFVYISQFKYLGTTVTNKKIDSGGY